MTPVHKEQLPPDPEALIYLKDELLARWKQLPPAHQAPVALVLLGETLGGEYGAWMRDVVELLMKGGDPHDGQR